MVSHKHRTQSTEEIALAPGVGDATARLAELRELTEDWDSYGGKPPTSSALRSAESLIADLANDYGRILGETATPNEVFPNPDGGLELEWSEGNWMLGVEIGPEGDARYLIKIGKGSDARYTKGSIQATASEVNHLLSALR
jgi:hypothetical protein